METILFAYISGSATRGTGDRPLKFPEELIPNARGFSVIEDGVRYKTPWGLTVPIRILEIGGAKVIWCPTHNWQKGFTGAESSLQLFHVLHKFGVQYLLIDASVGGIAPLKPWDLVVPDDLTAFNDSLAELALRTEGLPLFIRMAEPFCPRLRQILIQAARDGSIGTFGEIADRGVYVSKPLGRFETPAEVQIINAWRDAAFGGRPAVLGESLGLEAEGARRIGAHAAELCLVANYAEGTSPDKRWWVEEGRENFYQRCPLLIAPIMLEALKRLIQNPPTDCDCRFYWEDAIATSHL